MTPTSVGMRCPDCAGERTKVRRLQGRGAAATYARPMSPYDPRTWSITQLLVVINVLVFLWEVSGGVSLGGDSIGGFAYTHGVLLGLPLTGHNPYPPPFSGSHEYWRLLTSGFLHASIIHIGFNMLSLYFVGRSLEPAIGKLYFAAVYFTGLLCGSFGALLFTPDAPTLGASGAIFAVFGALIMVARARRIPLWQSGLLPILIFNFVYTLTVAGVSLGGHLGGCLSGFVTGYLVTEYGEKRDRRAIVIGGCLLIAVASVIGSLLVAGDSGLAPHGTTI